MMDCIEAKVVIEQLDRKNKIINSLIEAAEDIIEAYDLENNYGTSINNLKEIKQSTITKLAKAIKEARDAN